MFRLINNYNKISTILLCLVAATLCCRVNLGNVILIISVIYSSLFIKNNLYKLKYFALWFPILIFLIALLSSLFSKNVLNGINHLDLVLLNVLIVVIFIPKKVDKSVIHCIMKVFFYSITIATLILLFNSVFNFLKSNDLDTIVFHNFTSLYDQHPVYYSMYISLALFSLFARYSIYSNNKLINKISISILILGLLLCASKAIISIYIICFFLYVAATLKKIQQKIALLFGLVLFVVVVLNIPFIKNRFSDGLRFSEEIKKFQPTNDFTIKKQFTYDEKESISDLELRYIFGKLMIYHFLEDGKMLFGYGQGDIQNYIDYYFFSYNLGPNWYEDYNVHNQYIHIILTYGVLVLLLFLAYLGYSYFIAIKHKDSLHLFFLIMSCFIFIFEVTLVRNKGILFFYFFNTLFLISHINFENSNYRDKRNTKLSWGF